MKKQELLDDLLSRDFIGYVSAPVVMEEKPDGAKSYVVNVREESTISALYRNVYFYVVDEGLGTEVAFYKDADVARTLVCTVFKDFVYANFKSVVPDMVDYTWITTDEDAKVGTIKAMLPDPDSSGEYTVKGYMVADISGTLVMLPFSLSTELVVGS